MIFISSEILIQQSFRMNLNLHYYLRLTFQCRCRSDHRGRVLTFARARRCPRRQRRRRFCRRRRRRRRQCRRDSGSCSSLSAVRSFAIWLDGFETRPEKKKKKMWVRIPFIDGFHANVNPGYFKITITHVMVVV